MKYYILYRTLVDEYCGGPSIDNNVYIHTIIIGLSCIPTSFWLPLCVHRLGAKFFLGKKLIFSHFRHSICIKPDKQTLLFSHFLLFQFDDINEHDFFISIVFSLVVAGAVTIGLYFVHNSLENLILSCIFEALTSLGISTVYCVMVDLFPTNLRYDVNYNFLLIF